MFTGAGASPKPIRLAKRIESWLVHTTKADPRYAGVLTHSPKRTSHAPARDWRAECPRKKPYTLAELRRCVDEGYRTPRRPHGGISRRYNLLRELGKWYGQPANWEASIEALLDVAEAIDADYEAETGYREGREGLRPSIEGVWRHQQARLDDGEQQRGFAAIQSARARKSPHNAINSKQLDLLRRQRAKECTLKAAADTAGVSLRTASTKVGGTRAEGDRRRRKRRELVAMLHGQGKSLREIAVQAECGKNTVQRDLQAMDAEQVSQ